ncbi:RDD family protein [Agromyces aerolatus]|uniref:RDD family protein n=1 Tax=Agromyces sp. LY-1074 TaxID=3074080 RepID=UPI002854D004|nr:MULTISPECIES: RDD family protein [unclassified Agromyces]MDR5699846.1 RDD family protein [Agromyces sp. LY-1074]MDR5706342.1 RDD family protein [Agromyces sp. LY-1358]
MSADRPVTRSADDPLITGEAVALDVRPASAVIRAGGTAIDVIVSLLLLLGIALALAGLQVDEAATRAILITSTVTVLVIVPTAVETATHGRSLGKLVMGLRVVRDDGGAIGFRHAFVRALTGVLEIYLTFGGLAVLVGFLNPSSKRLGDILAGTHAQIERAPKVHTQTFGVPAELTAWASTADIGRLPDPLARRVAAFFANAAHLMPASRLRVAASLADEVAPYVEPRPEAPPERFLAAVVAIRRERDLTALRREADRLAALAPVLDPRPADFPRR